MLAGASLVVFDQQDQVSKEPFGIRHLLNHRWIRLCAPDQYRHYSWPFLLLNSGVHVQVTNLSVRLYEDIFLNCMTVQMATELSVVGHLVASYLFVFFDRYCIKVQLCFSHWYLKTSVLQWTSCKDVLAVCSTAVAITSAHILTFICLCCLTSVESTASLNSTPKRSSSLKVLFSFSGMWLTHQDTSFRQKSALGKFNIF